MKDPIQFEVMRSALNAATEEMAAALRKAAFSTNIKTRADFSCALFDTDLRLLAQSFSQPIHLASMARLVPMAVRKYGADRLHAGDVLATNDSHNGSMHLNDICLIAPFFDDTQCRGYVAAVAHHVDIGGMAPGGLCVSSEIYQEGIIIPVVKLLARGEMRDDIFRLILANIRSPRQTAGDIRAQIAAVSLGQRRMADIWQRFGSQTVTTFAGELIEYTRRWAESEIRQLPEGVYTASCFLDDDGIDARPIRLQLQATVHDGRVVFDLSGSDPQRPGPMNATLTYAYSAVTYVIKCLIDSDVPTNDGFYQLIEVHAPEGTVVNALPPSGVVGGNDIALRLCDLGLLAFSEALPQKVVACSKSMICNMGCGGRHPVTGEYYTFMETMGGGYGARPDRDGIDAVQPHIQNTENSAIEETENQYPLQIVRYELQQDSEGPGRWRGGMGVRRDWRYLAHAATVTIFADMSKNRPWGLFGGGAGAGSQFIVNPDAEAVAQPSKITLRLTANDVLSYRTPGGGGYGDARERPHIQVMQDYREERISAHRALALYGVDVYGVDAPLAESGAGTPISAKHQNSPIAAKTTDERRPTQQT